MKFFHRSLKLAGVTALLMVSWSGSAAPNSRNGFSARYVFDDYHKAIDRELASRNQLFRAQDNKMEKAKKLMEIGKFKEGVMLAETVLNELQEMNRRSDSEIVRRRLVDVEREVKLLRSRWGKNIFDRARMAIVEKRYNDAVVIASEAQNVDKTLAAEAKQLIDDATRMLKSSEFNKAASFEKTDPQLSQRRKTVKKLLQEAEVFMRNKKYEDARNRVEQVYLLSPNNPDAVELMSRVYRQLYTYGVKRKEIEMTGMSTAAAWQWVEPVFSGMSQDKTPQGQKEDNSGDRVLARMDRIIFPTIKFEDADIIAVLKLLETRSKVFDPEKEGVDISFKGDKKKVPKVSLELTRIPMSELIRYICDDCGLKFRVESNGVLIGPEVDPLQTRFFQIRGNLIDGITGEGDSQVIGGGGGGGLGAEGGEGLGGGRRAAALTKEAATGSTGKESGKELGKLGESEEAKDFFTTTEPQKTQELTGDMLKTYFRNRGIEFNGDSSILYEKSRGGLTVRNTLENLRKMDLLIRQLDAIETPMIQVEIRCIEVKEKDFQELGFNWSLDDSGIGHGGTVTTDASGNRTFSPSESGGTAWTLKQGTSSENTTIRSTANATGETSASDGTLLNKLNIFPALFGTSMPFGSDFSFNLYLTINAICQNTRTETLSAPKVLVSSGSKEGARIELVKTYFFPDSWETYELEVEDGQADLTPPEPEFGDATDVGIIFEVKARVNPDNYTINLQLHPSITNYVGKDIQVMNIEGVQTNLSTKEETPTKQQYQIWMPVITQRGLSVNVNVYDGHTLVLGGIIDNSMYTQLDKLPFFADLPIIGRFFQSQAEIGERNNMLLFVTARLIGVDGVPLQLNAEPGIPDFKR